MGNPTLTEDLECVWPERFGSWAERAPSQKALCRTVRAIPWRLRPPTAGDVLDVLREAVSHRTPIWPISRGCNWGYGSHLPARSGSVVLDLSRLEAISDLDRPSISVRIEPGVTQSALFAFLQRNAPDLTFNVTGAGGETSVLGNALERGIGYGGEKDRDVFAIEAILPDGTRVSPAQGRNHKSRPSPAGFSTDALFFQTNFGVVLGAPLPLSVRQEAEDAVVMQGPFDSLIGTLKCAYERQLIVNPTHVAEPGRTQSLGFGLLRSLWNRDPSPEEVDRCFPEQHTFTGLVSIYGRRSVVNAVWREVRKIAGPRVVFRRANARTLDFAARWLALVGARYSAARLMAMRPILALTWGEPSDAGMTALDGYDRGDPDFAARGAIYGNAVSSFDPAEARRAEAIVRRRWDDCAFTWILVDCRSMLTIYTLHFDDGAAADAHAANSAIVQELRASGFPPYRLDISTPAVGAEAAVGRLKAAFDPLGVIAPGRYEPRCADA